MHTNPLEAKCLYKYRTPNIERLKDIVIKNKLYFANPTQFNDPFDCKPNVTTHKSLFLRQKYIKSMIKQENPDISKKQLKKEAKNRYWYKYFHSHPMCQSSFRLRKIIYLTGRIEKQGCKNAIR